MTKKFYAAVGTFILGIILFFIFHAYLESYELYIAMPIMIISIVLIANYFPYSDNKYIKLGLAAMLTLVYELVIFLSKSWPGKGIDLYFGILIFLAPITYTIIFLFDTRMSFDIVLKISAFAITLPLFPLSLPLTMSNETAQIALVSSLFGVEVILDAVIILLCQLKSKEFE